MAALVPLSGKNETGNTDVRDRKDCAGPGKEFPCPKDRSRFAWRESFG